MLAMGDCGSKQQKNNVHRFQHFDMNANCSFGRLEYKSSTGKHGIERTGQEKLFYADFMACIAYFYEYYEFPSSVVVAGGASGVHFIKLVNIFPSTIQWHLYDPEPFARDLQHFANVHLHKQLYTVEDCKSWAKQHKVLFLSDIRNVNYTPTVDIIQKLVRELSCIPRHTRKRVECKNASELQTKIRHLQRELENMALEDMKIQAQMVKDTEAEMSFVKFRLPYANHGVPQFYRYLKGRVFFQAMNRCNSTECRLMVIPENAHTYKQTEAAAIFKDVSYDVLEHEELCAFINNKLRPDWDRQAIKILEDIAAELGCPIPVE
jgi:hypothetical protein